MTTEEKLDALIDAVSCFTNVMMTTMQGVAAIVRANNESSDDQTYEIDGKKMTLTEYQNMITKMQLDAQYEEAKLRQQESEIQASRLTALEKQAEEEQKDV